MLRLFALVPTLLLLFAATASAVEPPNEVAKPGEDALVSSEFICALEGRQTPQCHASTIAQTPSGFVAAWFGGTREGDDDVGIWVARKTGDAWTKPTEVANGVQADGDRHPCWNPVLFQPDTGDLLLFYKIGPNPRQWWGMLMTSSDEGKTWSKPHRLGNDDALGEPNTMLAGPVKNKPIQLKDGSILCPSSSEHQNWRVHFERYARDAAGEWKLAEVSGPIHSGEKFNAIQPSILTYKDGRMQVVCRSKESKLVQSWSSDGGKTWGPVTATDLPNPNSGTDAVTLQDGRQLLVYNHTVRSGKYPSGRAMLNVAISADGVNWQPVLTLERERAEFSYPAVIQAKDGLVHITYTYKRQTVRHAVVDLEQLGDN